MVCIYHMVSGKKPFTPTDYMEMAESCSVQSKVVLNDENVFAYLKAQGYDICLMVKRNHQLCRTYVFIICHAKHPQSLCFKHFDQGHLRG